MKTRSHFGSLLPTFWVGASLLAAYALFQSWDTPPLVLLTGMLLAACALVPSYLWCAGQSSGLPIFPMMALPYVWAFAIPLLKQQTLVADYDVAAQVQAGLTAILFLIVATLVWWFVLWVPGPPPRVVLALREDAASRLFLIGLAASCLIQMASNGGWLPIPWGLVTILNAVNAAASSLAVIVLASRLGRRQLAPTEKSLFVALLLVFLLITTSTLLLIQGLATCLLAVIAFTMGRGKLPLLIGVVALGVFAFLHLGKAPMRAAYWNAEAEAVQPLDYPMFYLRWVGYSLDALPEVLQPQTERTTARLDERGSLIHMTLLVQDKTPQEVPYLGGETYTIIPGLLVPRFINPDKLRSHEGTFRLAIAYGLQTEEATLRTTIAFGLLAEAYANFGYTGVVGLAILLGWGYGAITRASRHAPLTSLRGLAALLIMASAIQAEYTAGVLVTVLAQTGGVLLVAALVLMRPESLRHSAPSRKRTLPIPA